MYAKVRHDRGPLATTRDSNAKRVWIWQVRCKQENLVPSLPCLSPCVHFPDILCNQESGRSLHHRFSYIPFGHSPPKTFATGVLVSLVHLFITSDIQLIYSKQHRLILALGPPPIRAKPAGEFCR